LFISTSDNPDFSIPYRTRQQDSKVANFVAYFLDRVRSNRQKYEGEKRMKEEETGYKQRKGKMN
jgi:hypothetical protein